MKRVSSLALVVVAVGLGVAVVQSQGRQSQVPNSADPILRLDPSLDAIVPAGAKLEILKPDYFGISEGPVWIREGVGDPLFSDIGANMIYKWTPDGQLSNFLDKAGFSGADAMLSGVGINSFNGRLIVWNYGPNGLALDPQGRLIVCQQRDRALMRVEKDGKHTILVDRFEGKRLNGPNDVVVKSDGAVYFSDPGSELRADSPQRELPFRGTFMVKDGKVQLLEKELPPNGVAFSPDEKQFYMSGGGQISRYDVRPDDTLANRQPFGTGGCDGMKVDQKGNLYCSASTNGVTIFSPAGKHIGTIRTPDGVTNLAFGDADYKTLYITARRSLVRVRLNIPGTHF